MEKIMEFLNNHIVQTVLMSLWMLLEYWLGKTDIIKSGSSLEIVLSGIKKLLELLGIKKKPDTFLK